MQHTLPTFYIGIIASLGEYRAAMADTDAERLCTLLKEGKRCKESAK